MISLSYTEIGITKAGEIAEEGGKNEPGCRPMEHIKFENYHEVLILR